MCPISNSSAERHLVEQDHRDDLACAIGDAEAAARIGRIGIAVIERKQLAGGLARLLDGGVETGEIGALDIGQGAGGIGKVEMEVNF
jgi:hypothetical protein